MEKADDDSNLPSEIVCFEILPRLPRASLMQFRCVSKSWKALLTTNPDFWRIHQNFHPHDRTGHLLLSAYAGSGSHRHSLLGYNYVLLVKAGQQENTPSHVTDLMTLPCPSSQTIYANGLVLGRSRHDLSVYVFNPFTRESVVVPDPTVRYEELFFGFSPSTNEYKVVATCGIKGTVGFKIFTLGQASWRNMVFHPRLSHLSGSNVCVHGALHWLAPGREAILALDIGDERFRIIPIPSQCKSIEHKNIVKVDKCLGLVCILTEVTESVEILGLWILKDYKRRVWVEETTIKTPDQYPSFFPQCTTHTGEILGDVFPYSHHLQLYDRKSKSDWLSEIVFPPKLRDLELALGYEAVCFDDCVAHLK